MITPFIVRKYSFLQKKQIKSFQRARAFLLRLPVPIINVEVTNLE
jgi:hypothetical protein